MKKSLIALATLAAFAGAASAQSSVTLYGRVDISINKPTGSALKNISNGSGSRFGVRGVEDLGGGLSGIFQIEHRFAADTGGFSDASRMWGGRSIVGVRGGFGQVLLGREYTTAFLMSQLVNDPWGWDTVVSGTPGGGLNQLITGGAIARVRNDSSITYNVAGGGFSFGAQIAEATDTLNNFQSKPINFALGYAAGPLALNFGYERTGQEAAAAAKWMTIGGSFNMGGVKLGAMLGSGNTAANAKHRSYLVTAVAPMGAGEFRASYGQLRNRTAGRDAAKGFGLGYHYSLSKRTTIYGDIAQNSAAATSKTGYDVGIKHNF
ncbi:MAG: porin [Rubrivivax sp.]|nr:porin [Rubrivivax sp.]